jgi:hypothetical protein
MKKIIFEEIVRINELMGTESKLITEQAMFLSKIGDDLWRFVRKAQKGFVQKDIDNIVSKGQRDGIESLTDKELKTLSKHLDFQSLAKKYYDEGLIVSKNSLNTTLTSRIRTLKEEGAETYPEMVQGIRDGAKDNFFGLIPDLGEEYYPFANAFADELIENIDNVIQKTEPELWKEIGAVLRKSPKTLSGFDKVRKSIATGIDELELKNIQTIARALTRVIKKEDKLKQEFVDVSQEMANRIAQGKTTYYYEKKLTDILTAIKQDRETEFRNIYKLNTRDPNFPKGEMMRDFEASADYSELMKIMGRQPSWLKIIREDAMEWVKLFNFKQFNKQEFWVRWWNLVLKGSPVSFEQMAKRLQQKGLRPYFISQVIGAYLVKYVIFPALFTVVRTFVIVFGEASQWLASLVGYETPWNPMESGESWRNMFFESFMSAIPQDLRLVLPWNSLIDNIILAAWRNDKKAAEDFMDKTIRPDVLDGAKKIKEGKIDEIKEVLIEDDLKQLIPQEFHEFLGRRLDGKYEIRSPKDETTSLIYKKSGVWGIEAKNEQGQIVLLPLNDTDVIKSLNSWMLGPIKK